jgi:hypothetical protein
MNDESDDQRAKKAEAQRILKKMWARMEPPPPGWSPPIPPKGHPMRAFMDEVGSLDDGPVEKGSASLTF